MKRYQWIVLGGAIPWIWIGAAQAGTAEISAQQTAAQGPALMLPLEFAAYSVPLTPRAADLWLSSWLPEQLEVRKGSGFAMTRPVRVGRTDLQLGLAGPVMRKKNLGLTVEVRF